MFLDKMRMKIVAGTTFAPQTTERIKCIMPTGSTTVKATSRLGDFLSTDGTTGGAGISFMGGTMIYGDFTSVTVGAGGTCVCYLASESDVVS